MIKIDSRLALGEAPPSYPESQLKYEPMLFSCDWESAYLLGNEPTRKFLLALPNEWQNNKTIIDSRVHMLMPGWYPCIPGYHHDDVPRTRPDGQPDYFNPAYRSEHAMVLYNGDICPTEFAIGESLFSDVPIGQTYYKVWHDEVLKKINTGDLQKVYAPANRIIFFNDRTWHQGVKANSDGWRLFIRASRNTGRIALNETRKQVQVYLENPMDGW